jgi:hypothetical protein
MSAERKRKGIRVRAATSFHYPGTITAPLPTENNVEAQFKYILFIVRVLLWRQLGIKYVYLYVEKIQPKMRQLFKRIKAPVF